MNTLSFSPPTKLIGLSSRLLAATNFEACSFPINISDVNKKLLIFTPSFWWDEWIGTFGNLIETLGLRSHNDFKLLVKEFVKSREMTKIGSQKVFLKAFLNYRTEIFDDLKKN